MKACGYTPGLLQLLNTCKETGIVGDKKDLLRRQLMFGKNHIAIPTITSFTDLLASQFEDQNIIFLIIAATVYLGFAVFSADSMAYVETLTIYVGVLFAAVVSAFADWIKERQYLKIKDEVNNATVIVFRG